MTTLTIVTFEPNRIGVYIDGSLHDKGETYMKGDILCDIIESDREIDDIEREYAHYERWEGMPKTLEEVDELYELE